MGGRRYLAHSVSPLGHVDLVRDHLKRVGDRAARYGDAFGAAEEARVAGLLHDLGKYGERFQLRLEGKERGVDHWSAGAWHALTTLRQNGVAAALAIQGHHLGLTQASKSVLEQLDPAEAADCRRDGFRPSTGQHQTLLERFSADGLSLSSFDRSVYDTAAHLTRCQEPAAGMLDVRMLFSALVDADFEETAAHFHGSAEAGAPVRAPGPRLAAEPALQALLDHIAVIEQEYKGGALVLHLRRDLLAACMAAAKQGPGLFTLTAPTGSGKTLSMMAFALAHALQNNLRRVVIVVPYLTIIEQSVAVYREALLPAMLGAPPTEYVLEDHSLAGSKDSPGDSVSAEDEQSIGSARARELAENWDAPVIVTTSVQFLESLFANRSSACRKLHRLARSVVLFDEVQTIPKDLAVPTLATLGRLADRYGSSIVFSTATQPAFSHLDGHVRTFCGFGWVPTEIVPGDAQVFERAKRAELVWPALEERISWSELADKIISTDVLQVLCIVNLKRHALALYGELRGRLGDSVFHMSTNMCPAHRSDVLDEIRRRLSRSQDCVLVSTQCVEAGVDLDFPTVYRAFAPLDAVAQAAGRCNRNGRLQSGKVHVFEPMLDAGESGYPDGAYRQAADVTRMLLERDAAHKLDVDDTKLFDRYFRMLYQVGRPEQGRKDILEAVKTQDFEEVARRYRLIEKDAIDVLVCYDGERFSALRDDACRHGVTRDWVRQARAHSIGLFRPSRDDPMWSSLEPLPSAGRGRLETWFAYTRREDYLQDTGLVPSTSLNCLIA